MQITVNGSAVDVDLEMFVVAGYTARDREAVLHHIHELEELGVAPPPYVPYYWRFPAWLAQATDRVVVSGTQTSGEAEVALVVDGAQVYVTVGSDHTDRAAEALDVGMSKAICPKVIGSEAWTAESIGGRWSELELRSWITVDGEEVLYQEGQCVDLTPPLDLLAGIPFERPQRFAMLTGTVPAIGGVRPASHFRAELRDPANGRTLAISYDIVSLEG